MHPGKLNGREGFLYIIIRDHNKCRNFSKEKVHIAMYPFVVLLKS